MRSASSHRSNTTSFANTWRDSPILSRAAGARSHTWIVSPVRGMSDPQTSRTVPSLSPLKSCGRLVTPYRSKGRDIRLRCCFLEHDREAYGQLEGYVKGATDVESLTLNSSFEESAGAILRFIRKERETFPFLFIDPTGWTGFALKTISPL